MYPVSTVFLWPHEHLADASFTAPAAIRIFLREICWKHGDSSGSYLRIRDLTEHRRQALKQQHCFQALQETGWTRRLISSHCVSHFPLRPSSSASSFSVPAPPSALSPYTALDRGVPEWLTITGLMSSFLQHSVCCWGSLSCLRLSKDVAAATAAGSPNLLHSNWGSSLAVRAHQLINRAGVGYSHLVLPRTGS